MKKIIEILLVSSTYLLLISCGTDEAIIEGTGGVGSGQVTTRNYYAYVVNHGSNNVSIHKINSNTGGLTLLGSIGAGGETWPSELDPLGRFFYAGNQETDDLSVYQINSTNGTLSEVAGSPFTAGQWPEGMYVHPNGRFVYLVDSTEDKIFVYEVSSAGTLTQIAGSPFTGRDNPNDCIVHPNGKYLYVAYWDDANVGAYSIDESTGALSEMAGSPYSAGAGAVSITINNTAQFLYVVNNNAKNISAYSINQNTGALTAVPGSPFTNSSSSGPYDSVITPDGKFFYTTTWGWDYNGNDVTVFSIDDSSGALSLKAKYYVGFGLSAVAVHPNGQFLYVSDGGDWDSPGEIFAFSIDNENGSLTELSGSPFPAYIGTGNLRIQAIDEISVTSVEEDTDPVFYHNLCVNNTVRTQVLADNGILYLGGDFTKIGKCSGAGVYLNIPNGGFTYPVEKSTFPLVGGTVYESVSDGSGGYYIGGSFSKVGSSTRNNIAHVDSSGNLSSFAPNVNGPVKSLALSSDGSVIYFGGEFTSVDGITRNYIAACYTSDGSVVSAFNPNSDWHVEALALKSDNSILYMGGFFSSIGGTIRNNIAAVNTGDGSLVGTFNPSANTIIYDLTLSSDDSTLYVGGGFTTIGGASKKRIAAINTSDGSLVAGFTPPDLDNSVYTLKLTSDNATIYIGGAFTDIGGTTRNRIAALSTSNGALVTGFNPNSNEKVRSLELNGDGSVIYVGGDFTNIAATARNKMAALNTSDGSIVSIFNPNFDNSVRTIALSSSGLGIYVGGSFVMLAGTDRNRIAAINTANGRLVTTFDPDANNVVKTLALKSDGSVLFLGGQFTTVDGTARNRLAAVNTNDGSLVSGFDPNSGGEVQSLAITGDDTILYLGGDFTTVGGTTRNNLAAVSTSNGSLIGAFDPNCDDVVSALALTSDDGTLYLGGNFGNVGGSARTKAAAVSTVDASLVAGFNPNIDNQVWSLLLNSNESILYIGGDFSFTGGGVTRSNLVALNTSDASPITAFNPGYDGPSAVISVKSLALTSDNSTLYVGGKFTAAGATARNYIAAHNTSSGSALAGFNPNADATVHSLILNSNESKLFVGGEFTTIGGTNRGKITELTTADGSPVNHTE